MKLELWGGVECTVNRVGDRYFDQTRRTGHHDRIEDLELFADLGITALRYPLVWERVAPDRAGQYDWSWSDRRLERLDALKIRPILGLVHHGSGPRYTGLLKASFAPGLARFAGAAARRYPHVLDWTPVNEPLTTARFAALYGHWHPHLRDEGAFWIALLNEVDAVRMAMAEIRKVTPTARLIQTEDLGRTYGTAVTAGQAAFDNERRWATWDLLFGRVTGDHPLHERLVGMGLGERLKAIADAPCPPDVVGVNHYVTSDRLLDHRVDAYPAVAAGGNASLRFADVEAVRALLPAPAGLEGVLEEAWSRYGAALAITESHLGCTREEQMRWIREGWETALRVKDRGADVVALTVWSLLGTVDWSRLLTREDGCYEPGAFDVRGGRPRPTGVASLVRALASGSPPPWPAQGAGWWRRDIRLVHRPVVQTADARAVRGAPPASVHRQPPLLITGATGTLGAAFARACALRGLPYVLTGRAVLDLEDPASIETALDAHRPWAVVNAAGWVRVDEAEAQARDCMRSNAQGASNLARAARARSLPFVGFSSDLVFDGRKAGPYLEEDQTAPLNVYGRSKALAEQQILALGGSMLMIRTAAFFSPLDPHNFAASVISSLSAGETFRAAADLVVSPTYVPDLTDAVLDLLIDGAGGLWHLTSGEAVSWAEFAARVAEASGFSAAGIRPCSWREFGWAAERPPAVALASRYGALLPPLADAVARFAAAVGEGSGEAALQPALRRKPEGGAPRRSA